MTGGPDQAELDMANRRRQLARWIDAHHGGQQAAFLRAHPKLNQGEISALLRSKSFGSTKARNLEQLVGMPTHYLEQRDGAAASPNAVVVSSEVPLVPLISWVRAGNWSSTPDPFLPGDADEWIPCPAKHGPNTIALRVTGDSMLDPLGKHSYADGDIIFVDPDRTPGPGDRCVVRLDDRDEATFKQLVVEDGRRLLKALNPEWKPRYLEMDENATMVGLVIGKWVPE